MANDLLVSEAVSRGSLQINEYLPLIAHAMLETTGLLTGTAESLAVHINGITANPEKCREFFDSSSAVITAFVPVIGYDRCSELIKEFKAKGLKSIREYLLEKLGKDIVDKTLSPANLISLGHKNE
jgi:aspartate ammonia-lyase